LARLGVERPLRFGGVLPGWSSLLGGIEESPLLRDNRCSNRATFTANSS
jgi:hypothetical protein